MPCDPVHPPADPADQRDGHRLTRRRTDRKARREAGFTLIEVMVVIVIIALLSTAVVVNVLPQLDQGRVKKAKIDIATLSEALELYKLDNMTYPRTEDGLQALVAPPASLSRPERYREGGYIKRLPPDPWGNPYRYAYPGRSGPFDIYSLGADNAEGGSKLDADIGTWNLDEG